MQRELTVFTVITVTAYQCQEEMHPAELDITLQPSIKQLLKTMHQKIKIDCTEVEAYLITNFKTGCIDPRPL